MKIFAACILLLLTACSGTYFGTTKPENARYATLTITSLNPDEIINHYPGRGSNAVVLGEVVRLSVVNPKGFYLEPLLNNFYVSPGGYRAVVSCRRDLDIEERKINGRGLEFTHGPFPEFVFNLKTNHKYSLNCISSVRDQSDTYILTDELTGKTQKYIYNWIVFKQ